ncbi:MAG: hypothetical protein HC917_23940 [Richelia sp. SM2_1_7]|nr:hypothetical protein [Richelia sp. SM2_1_7]
MFIFGQNLQPSNLGVKKPDLHNTSWLFMPKNIGSAFVYKATETDKSSLESEHQKIREVVQADRNLRFYGLYFPVEGDAFYSQLPAPNTYAIPRDTSRTPGEHPESSHEDTADLGKMAKNAKQAKPYSVSVRPCFDEMAKINSECLKQSQKLDIEDFGELPKSMTTGKVKKTEVYKLLKVKSAKHQKLVKEYIDYMDKEYNT